MEEAGTRTGVLRGRLHTSLTGVSRPRTARAATSGDRWFIFPTTVLPGAKAHSKPAWSVAAPGRAAYYRAMETAGLGARLRDFFSHRRDGLVAVYLFGGRARGTATESSDVDLGLLYRDPPPPDIGGPPARVEDDLEALLGRPVEAVVLNTAPPDLVHRVLRDGELVHETDRSRRIRFEVAARREYFDLLPILREYRRRDAAAT